MPKNLTCFISHNSKDKLFAEKLCNVLHSQGIETWFDKYQIFGGDSISDKVQYGLEKYDIFLIILSHNSINAPWVKEELRVAYQNRLSKTNSKKIIPLLLDNCKLPTFLKDYLYVPFLTKSKFKDSVNKLLDAIIFDKVYLTKYKANYAGGFIVNKAFSLVKFKNKKITEFLETISNTSLKKLNKITRDFTSDGVIRTVNFDAGKIKRKIIRSSTERWELEFTHNVTVKKIFDYELKYTLENEFKISNNWFYTIDSPTRELKFIFEFKKGTEPQKIIVKHYQTLTTIKTILLKKLVMTNTVKFEFNINFPVYKDRFEFEW